MSAHVYWRLKITANAGDGSFTAVGEIELRATVGGADQCSGGTPFASGSYNESTWAKGNAFDNSAATAWLEEALVGWIGYKFASAVSVLEYTVQAPPTNSTRSPATFELQWSDDGNSWAAADSRSGQTWTNGEIKTFEPVAGTGKTRTSQVAVEVLRTNTGVVARTSQVAVEVLRINTGTVVRTSQVAVEVLRPNVAAASVSARPMVFVCT